MDKKKRLWITLSLVNLSIAALFGMLLRSKYLFPISFIDYRNLISAHSHFAFGGWVTLSFLTLFIYHLLPEGFHQKKIYQVILWGIELTSLGMATTFPFSGYSLLSVTFSTVFIFITYAFTIVFIRDLLKAKRRSTVVLLSIAAVISLAVSSIGPFTLAYILATHSTDSILYRNAVYVFLHFQYNGFFTLSIFALLFYKALPVVPVSIKKKLHLFAVFLVASVLPTLFLTLLWHQDNIIIKALGIIGCGLIILSVVQFFTFIKNLWQQNLFTYALAKTFFLFSMLAFIIKMTLQLGTIIPPLKNAVFGYRPIIIGFLHLVFLGLVSFYILYTYIESHVFNLTNRLSKPALILFATAIILNETILMIQGIGLMFYQTSGIYAWLLWITSIFLFTGAVLIVAARLKKPVISY